MEKRINTNFEIDKKRPHFYMAKTVDEENLIGFIIKEPIKIIRKLDINNFLPYLCYNCKYGNNTDIILEKYKKLFSIYLLKKFNDIIKEILSVNVLDKIIIEVNLRDKNLIKYKIDEEYFILYLNNKVFLSCINNIKNNIFFDISKLLLEYNEKEFFPPHNIPFADCLILIDKLNNYKDTKNFYSAFNFLFNINELKDIKCKDFFFKRKFSFINEDLYYLIYTEGRDTVIYSEDNKTESFYKKISTENNKTYILNNILTDSFNDLFDLYSKYNSDIQEKLNLIDIKDNTSLSYCCNYKKVNIHRYYQEDKYKCKVVEDLINNNDVFITKIIQTNRNIIDKKITRIFKKENFHFNPIRFKKDAYICVDIIVKNFGLFINIQTESIYLLYKDPSNNDKLYTFLLGNVCNEDINSGICWGNNKIEKYTFNLQRLFQTYINSIFTLENIEFPFLLYNIDKENKIENYLENNIFLDHDFNEIELNIEDINSFDISNFVLIKDGVKEIIITKEEKEENEKIKLEETIIDEDYNFIYVVYK